jgi:hypothetical protein
MADGKYHHTCKRLDSSFVNLMTVTKQIPSLCKNINVIPLKLQPRDISMGSKGKINARKNNGKHRANQ